MAFGEALTAVSKRDVQLDDEMAVPWLVDGTAWTLAPLDDPEERECGELSFRVALLHAGPDRRTLRGVLAEGKRMKKTKPPRIGDPLEAGRGALVLFVAGALEQCGVAREEVQVPVFDGHYANRPNPAYDSSVVALLHILRECRMCSGSSWRVLSQGQGPLTA